MADGPPRRVRHHVLPPVWRLAPRRLLRDPLGLVLVVAVFTMVAVASSAGPLYAEAVSDASLRLALESVPAGAVAKERPVVRVSGGVDPTSAQWSGLLTALDEVPGLTPPRVTTQSVSTELHSRIFYDPVGPVLTGADGRPGAPVRLFGVDDPADRLLAVSRMSGTPRGVWLPEPVAASAGVRSGDTVTLHLSGLPDVPTAATTVAGVYAVEPDGRTPREPQGRRWWGDLSAEELPSDARRATLPAHLVVADLATTVALADAIDDQLLWSAQSGLALPAQPPLGAAPHRDRRRHAAPHARGPFGPHHRPGGPAARPRQRGRGSRPSLPPSCPRRPSGARP